MTRRTNKATSSGQELDAANAYAAVTCDILRQQVQRYKRLLETVTNYVYMVELKDGLPVSTFNRLLFARETRLWGMDAVVVASGADALELLHLGEQFDLIVLDMHMPDMDGLMLADEIRKYQTVRSDERGMIALSMPQLPILMYTSIVLKSEAMRKAKGNITAFLTKPIKPLVLRDMLIQLCEGSKDEPATMVLSSQDSVLAQQHPLRILLAEDNLVNQKVVLGMLEKLGYRADVVGNGREALQAVVRQPYDVVLMDMMMPEMDGMQAIRHMREIFPASHHPWIIAMTGQALPGDRERLLENGMDDYVSKPVRVEELMCALRNVGKQTSNGVLNQAINQPASSSVPVVLHASTDPFEPALLSFDDSVLEQFRMLAGETGEALVRELIDLFLKETPDLIAGMQQSLTNHDVESWTRATHSLKSSSAQLGALKLSALCKESETIGREGHATNLTEKLAHIEAEFEQVRESLVFHQRYGV